MINREGLEITISHIYTYKERNIYWDTEILTKENIHSVKFKKGSVVPFKAYIYEFGYESDFIIYGQDDKLTTIFEKILHFINEYSLQDQINHLETEMSFALTELDKWQRIVDKEKKKIEFLKKYNGCKNIWE